ncbi:MAG: tRNA (adenosine(37)-N6)-dimethylallyltransferase MiaA [Kistimonas sp.]|nr:tRNA (adenosine(37)-N6)-dimethylallyltransferase MiaA [Kistimonas sp.]
MVVNQPPVIFLTGPTASGKTDLALNLCRVLPCDIISVDSALVFRGMDIGTAKPPAALRRQIPHHLIDIRDPAESYCAAQFRHDALKEIHNSLSRRRIPLLVGGTMLYYKALRDGLANLPPADAAVRQHIVQQAQQYGWEAVHAQLRQLDPQAAQRIQSTDPQRLQRALEVCLVTGRSLTSLIAEQKQTPFPFRLLCLALAPAERSQLHKRIAQRFHSMLANGFADEVAQLHGRGDLHPGLPSMRCVGYRQMWNWLEGSLSWEEMVDKAIIATRQMAKRQLTWLRSWQPLHWLDSSSPHCTQVATTQVERWLEQGDWTQATPGTDCTDGEGTEPDTCPSDTQTLTAP